ncbi:hypothetical protein HPB48_000548 [Haemaphysalis longicornis]|uniref:GH18 domain-containing protein n=1 Tax=Haemaphysalis longicornis TaxID=44386 RepID=A0A9J6FMY2_HAELO|nr:hypothetical protein HPB48_000548 [Haemaphysalis longicornis]
MQRRLRLQVDSKSFSDELITEGRREHLAQRSVHWLRARHMDGMHVQWMYPGEGNGRPSDRENFPRLLAQLRHAFKASSSASCPPPRALRTSRGGRTDDALPHPPQTENSRWHLTLYLPHEDDRLDRGYELRSALHSVHYAVMGSFGYMEPGRAEVTSPLFNRPPNGQGRSPVNSIYELVVLLADRGAPRDKLLLAVSATGYSYALATVRYHTSRDPGLFFLLIDNKPKPHPGSAEHPSGGLRVNFQHLGIFNKRLPKCRHLGGFYFSPPPEKQPPRSASNPCPWVQHSTIATEPPRRVLVCFGASKPVLLTSFGICERLICGRESYYNRGDTEVRSPLRGGDGRGRPGPFTVTPGRMAYFEICYNVYRNSWARVFDTATSCPYAYREQEWVTYDDADSLRAKVAFLRNQTLGGAALIDVASDDYMGMCGPRNVLARTLRSALKHYVTPTKKPAGAAPEAARQVLRKHRRRRRRLFG